MVKTAKKVAPKVNTSTKKSPAKKSWYKQMWPKQWVMVSLAVFLLLVLGYVLFNKYQIAQEKKQFAAAEAGLDTLYADIVKTIGQPTTVKKDVSCNYSSAKGSKGFLRCGTSYYIAYSPSSNEELVRIAEKTQAVLASNPKILVINPPRDRYIKNGGFSKVANFDIYNFSKGCVAGFDEVINQSTQSSKILNIDFVCGGDAKSEYYPVKD